MPCAKRTKRADPAENFFSVQTRAMCKKSLKRVAPSAKMTNRADLRQKALFCTNSCSLLKMAKTWCGRCKNDKTCQSRAENAVLYKLVQIAKNG